MQTAEYRIAKLRREIAGAEEARRVELRLHPGRESAYAKGLAKDITRMGKELAVLEVGSNYQIGNSKHEAVVIRRETSKRLADIIKRLGK